MIYQGDNFTISYKTYGDKKKQAIILFPPGIGFSSRLDGLAKSLSYDYYVISPDIPGVNDSLSESGNLKKISEEFAQFITSIKAKEPIILGYCHGGCIAINLSKIIKIKGLVLMGTGEYFTILQRIVIGILFFPAIISSQIKRLYSRLLTSFEIFEFIEYEDENTNLREFTDKQLRLVSQRWIQTVFYKLPKHYTNPTKTLIINSKNDKVCHFKNIYKLKKIYPNHTTKTYHCSHGKYDEKLKKESYSTLTTFLKSL